MRILAIGNAHALAHVSRLLEVAKILRKRGHSVVFAGHGKYLSIANVDGFKTIDVPYVSVEHAIRTIRSQRLWELFPESELVGFIESELKLYDQAKPDLILMDNRPTARTSAQKAGLRTASLMNVHMSNYRSIPFFSASNLPGLGRLPGVKLLDDFENRIELYLYDRLVMGGLNNIRQKFGLSRLFSYEHEEGDISFLADVPAFNPARGLPAHVQYVGPLTWHNEFPPPKCLDRLDHHRPVIYLSLGSESLEELVSQLGVLSQQGIQIVVAVGAANVSEMQDIPEGVFIERYINTDSLLPYCDLVCCHGGNGTLYQALSFGLPLVVVATHQEQHYGGKRIESLGIGRVTTLKYLRNAGFPRVIQIIQDVLETPCYRQAAQSFSHHTKGWNGAELAASCIERSIATH